MPPRSQQKVKNPKKQSQDLSESVSVSQTSTRKVSGQLAYLQTRLRQLAYAYGELAYVGEFDHLRRRV